jgi:hypothetical protein
MPPGGNVAICQEGTLRTILRQAGIAPDEFLKA